jgi:hypothetical protein
MALFRRSKTTDSPPPADLSTLFLEGEDMLERTAALHHQEWGLGTADKWGLDQTTGLITWTFTDRTAEAEAQILASHNSSAGTWVWACANPSILPALQTASQEVCTWLEDNGHAHLAQPKLAVTPDTARTLTALATRITKATGFYRGSGASDVLITFGPVTITGADGTSRTFDISLE